VPSILTNCEAVVVAMLQVKGEAEPEPVLWESLVHGAASRPTNPHRESMRCVALGSL
jgi:hypothetical protein